MYRVLKDAAQDFVRDGECEPDRGRDRVAFHSNTDFGFGLWRPELSPTGVAIRRKRLIARPAFFAFPPHAYVVPRKGEALQ